MNQSPSFENQLNKQTLGITALYGYHKFHFSDILLSKIANCIIWRRTYEYSIIQVRQYASAFHAKLMDRYLVEQVNLHLPTLIFADPNISIVDYQILLEQRWLDHSLHQNGKIYLHKTCSDSSATRAPHKWRSIIDLKLA